VIATSGVTCSHSELFKAARPYTALIAFDADYRTNPAVCRQFARLIVQRLNDCRPDVGIGNPFLAAAGRGIFSLQ